MLYGAEVNGVSDAMLLRMRRCAAAGVQPKARGRSLDVALLLADADPLKDACAAPICRWAKEVWEATSACLDARTL